MSPVWFFLDINQREKEVTALVLVRKRKFEISIRKLRSNLNCSSFEEQMVNREEWMGKEGRLGRWWTETAHIYLLETNASEWLMVISRKIGSLFWFLEPFWVLSKFMRNKYGWFRKGCVDVRRMDAQVMLTLCHHRVYIHPDVTHQNNLMVKTPAKMEDRTEGGIGTYEEEAFLRIERMSGCVTKEWDVKFS